MRARSPRKTAPKIELVGPRRGPSLPRAFYYWLGAGVLCGLVAALAVNWDVLSPVPPDRLVTVYRLHDCPCFRAWGEHLEQQGFVVRVFELDRLGSARSKWGNTVKKPGCHFAVAGGYFIEGHVAGEDIRRLLSEKPLARGIAVLGDARGLPGLEQAAPDPYDVTIFGDDGRAEVWVRHSTLLTRDEQVRVQ